MAVRVNHDLRNVDGQTLYLPQWKENQEGWGNLKLPDISLAGTLQRYPIGTRYRSGGRTYIYAKAGGTLNPDLGAKNALTQHVAYTTIAATALQYATTVVIDVGGSDGAAGDGVIAVNELAGGYLVVFDADAKAYTRQIVSNTAVATGEMTLVIDQPIPLALITDTDHAECMASPYLNLQANTDTISSVLGIPTLIATSGQYFWLQTWGPVWIAPQGAVSTGNNDRQVVFRHDGSIDQHDYSDAVVQFAQHAGFVLANASGGGQGAAFIMLQITP